MHAMANPHYRSQFGDTTLTKVFVGGLAWETPTEEMRTYFEQFGDILEAVIIKDKNTGKSKGYGFVTYRDPDSARRACENHNPVIDGRRANCNIASLGRPRASPPRGRVQGGGSVHPGGASSGVPQALPQHTPMPPPLPAPVIYPPYGYPNYGAHYGYHQAVYNPQFQHPHYYYQGYGSSSSSMSSPYYYGYSWPGPRATYPTIHAQPRAGPSYFYSPTQMEAYPHSTHSPQFTPPRPHPPAPSSTGSQTPQSTSTEARVVTSEGPSS